MSVFNFALNRGAPNPQGGFLDRLRYMRHNNPEALIALGSGMMRGDMAGGFESMAQQMAAHREKQAAEQQQNKTAEWLQRAHGLSPEDAMVIAQNPALLQHALKPGSNPTDDIREYEFAKQQGYAGSFQDWMFDSRRAGATNVNVNNGSQIGTIPQGYEVYEENGARRMRPIPGGPEDKSKMEATRIGQASTSSDTVLRAYERAREAAKARNFGPYGQGVAEIMPWTDSAEVRRQTDTLKSMASIENLTAMRQSSPTGGALGNVTEHELEILKNKTGALDPSSPNFERDLNDYVLTLLRTIHGPEAGDRIFAETMGPRRTDPVAPNAGGSARRRYNPATGRIE